MKRRFGLRALAGLTALAAAAVVALMVAGSGAATPAGGFDTGATYASIAGTDLHGSQVGSDSTTFTQDCSDFTSTDGSVLWHFVLVQTTAVNTGSLRAEFQNAGVTTPDIVYSKHVGGVLHWDVITPSSDVLLAASTDASGALLNLSHVCDGSGGGSGGGTSSVSTTVHLGSTDGVTPTVVDDNLNPAALGSSVHDSAALTFVGVNSTTLPAGSTVVFEFFHNNTCADPENPADSVGIDVGGQSSPASVDPALVEGPLAAGEYSYLAALISGDSNVVPDAIGDCEPFKISQGTTTSSTAIHLGATDGAGGPVVVTGPISSANSVVHDSATVTGSSTAFTPAGNVNFTFYSGGDCTTGTAVSAGSVALVNGVADPSTAEGPLAAGRYAFSAHYVGDTNYTGSDSACEPLTVFQLGKTMGFWGNQNGIARINGAGGYAANAVAIGRGSNIDTLAESLKVLPNTLNACGKGTPSIFTVGAATNTKDCTLATGINENSLNTLSAQTLALGYNMKLVLGYTSQSIGVLGCTAYLTAGLTASSTVNNAFAAAVNLIDHSASGGSTTQAQIGAMNLLLGCLNREA
jgi:hypothetical protein